MPRREDLEDEDVEEESGQLLNTVEAQNARQQQLEQQRTDEIQEIHRQTDVGHSGWMEQPPTSCFRKVCFCRPRKFLAGVFIVAWLTVMIVALANKQTVEDISNDQQEQAMYGWHRHSILGFALRVSLNSNETLETHLYLDWTTQQVRVDFHGNADSFHSILFVNNSKEYRLSTFIQGGQSCTILEGSNSKASSKVPIDLAAQSWNEVYENSKVYMEWIFSNDLKLRTSVPEGDPVNIVFRNETIPIIEYQQLARTSNVFESLKNQCEHFQNDSLVQTPTVWLRAAILSHCPTFTLEPILLLLTNRMQYGHFCFNLNIAKNNSVEPLDGVDRICQIFTNLTYQRRLSVDSTIVQRSCLDQSLLVKILNNDSTIQQVKKDYGLPDDLCNNDQNCLTMQQVLNMAFQCLPCDVPMQHSFIVPDPDQQTIVPKVQTIELWNFYNFRLGFGG